MAGGITIERTKGGRTHYAVSAAAVLGSGADGTTAVIGRGYVTEWSEDRAKAGQFPGGVARRVGEFHKAQKNAGTLRFLDGDRELGTVGDAARGFDESDPDAEVFRKQAEALAEELADERAETARLKGQLKLTLAEVDELTTKLAEAEALIASAK